MMRAMLMQRQMQKKEVEEQAEVLEQQVSVAGIKRARKRTHSHDISLPHR